jgi:Spy/CpxP family protein refolding chaperone
MKNGVTILLIPLATVLLLSMAMFGQTAQPSPQSNPAAAQPDESGSRDINDKDIEQLRANLRATRKELMAQNMNLTADEATKFWPVFDQYRKEAIKPNDERWALIKEYAKNYNTMTEVQAQDYMKRATAVDQELLALRLKYVPAFEKAVSPRKAALWYQIDRHIDLMINLRLSSVIPMVNTTSTTNPNK